jgi:hypothetical protein
MNGEATEWGFTAPASLNGVPLVRAIYYCRAAGSGDKAVPSSFSIINLCRAAASAEETLVKSRRLFQRTPDFLVRQPP